MSDLKPEAESLESLLSTAIGLLMGHKDRIGYKPGSVIAKFVDECVERLKDWPYTTAAQPAQAGQVLTDEAINKLAAENLEAFAQFAGAGEVWYEGETNFARAIESAVLARVARVPQWQPISTAPKDGTVVDLWHSEFGRMPGWYWGLPYHCCGEMGSYCDSDWHSLEPGWVDEFNEPHSVDADVTHWMPLPPPPGIVGEKGGAT